MNLSEKNTKSLLQIHVAVLLFGIAGLFGRYISQPAVIITLGRVFFAALSIMALFRLRGTQMSLKNGKDAAVLIVAGVILAFHWTSFFASIQASTVAIGVLTFSTYPLFVTFIEPLIFGYKLKISDIACALAMFAGVCIIVPEFRMANSSTEGIIWGMCSSFSYAVISLINRKYALKYSGSLIALYEQGTSAVALLPALFILKPAVTAADIWPMLLLGVVFTAGAHSLFISGMKHVRAQTAGMISSLESPYGIAAAALVFSEIPQLNEVIGGAVILAAALWSTLKSRN